MFQRLGDALRNFMIGRYGTDKLNTCLLICGIVLMLLGSILGRISAIFSIFSFLAYVPLIWSIFRIYSRNIEARRKENQLFCSTLAHIRDRENRYYRCPQCRQIVRVPRGRGRINIRCPRCSTRFIKKT